MSNIWKLILDTILMALVFLVIGLVVLFLFFAFKDDVQAMMIEPPEVCALCEQEPRTVPCLLTSAPEISVLWQGPLSPENSSTSASWEPWAAGIPMPRPATSPPPPSNPDFLLFPTNNPCKSCHYHVIYKG